MHSLRIKTAHLAEIQINGAGDGELDKQNPPEAEPYVSGAAEVGSSVRLRRTTAVLRSSPRQAPRTF